MSEKEILAQAILLGLDVVPKCGIPGNIFAFGSSSAFCPIETDVGGCPMGVAEFGSGRIIAFGHNGYLHDVASGDSERERRLQRLLRNCIIWGVRAECNFLTMNSIRHELACGPICENRRFSFLKRYPFNNECSLPIAIGAIGLQHEQLIKIVKRLGSPENFKVIASVPSSTLQDISKLLASHPDVILWTNVRSEEEITARSEITDQRAAMLLDFVHQGGSVITAVCPWGWESLSGGTNLAEQCVFNHFLEPAGLSYQGTYVEGDTAGNYPISEALKRLSANPTPADTLRMGAVAMAAGQTLSRGILKRVLNTLLAAPLTLITTRSRQPPTLAAQAYSAGVTADMQVLQNAAILHGANALRFPMSMRNELDFAKSTAFLFIPWFHRYWQTLSPNRCPKAPQIKDHPGEVVVTTPRLANFLFTLNPWLKGWQSTGIYVAPGEALYIKLSDQAVYAYPELKMTVRVGCHSDWLDLYKEGDDKYELHRWPRLVTTRDWHPRIIGPSDDLAFCDRSGPAKASEIGVASPYGGLLYIEILEGWRADRNITLTFRVDGGVMAPYWNAVLEFDEVPFTSWTNSYPHRGKSLRQRTGESGAPWGELEGRYIILSLPRHVISRIENPREVMNFFDAVVGHELALAGQQLDRKERIVPDKQISAGTLHSGYPIMGHLDLCRISSNGLPAIADLNRLINEPEWGIYHEIGHNRQRSEWTWSGLTEVTVNIFSLYATHMLNGKSPFQSSYYRDNCRESGIRYLQDRTKSFEDWSSDYNIALSTYVVLIEHFGWKMIADVMREYEAMDSMQKPQSDHRKISEWIRRTSKKVELDLRPFYRQWKWPVDEPDLVELNAFPPYGLDVLEVVRNS